MKHFDLCYAQKFGRGDLGKGSESPEMHSCEIVWSAEQLLHHQNLGGNCV